MIDLLTATLTATRWTISPSTKIITHDPTPDRDHRGQSRTPRMGLRIKWLATGGRFLSTPRLLTVVRPWAAADPITSRYPRCRRLSSRLSCLRSSLFAEESEAAPALIADGENPSEQRRKQLGKRVGFTPSRVRIPHPPPLPTAGARDLRACTRSAAPTSTASTGSIYDRTDLFRI
jgi:hypothetical protein